MHLTGSAFFALSCAALLAGCAGTMQHHGDMAHGSATDPQAMCAMHQQMMAGKTAAEQQAIMAEHMKSMAPEMRQRMQSMMGQCQ